MTLNRTKAIHTWSMFRVLGSYAAPGTMPGLEGRASDPSEATALLELPSLLASHGFTSAQICHFSLPTTDPSYLGELRHALDEAGVALEAFLVDHGDLAHPTEAAHWVDWISEWVEVADRLDAAAVRVSAGDQPPSPGSIARSAASLRTLAGRHGTSRILVENWRSLLVDARTTLELLDRCEGAIGFLLDFGNWTGPGKYEELAAVAALAESCQAKVGSTDSGDLDADDFRRCLDIMAGAGYGGPLSLVYDGTARDVWEMLDTAHALVLERADASAADPA